MEWCGAKAMHTCKVVAAYVRVHAKDFATKTRPPCKLVALRLINWQLVCNKIFTVKILQDVLAAEEKLKTRRELAVESLSMLALRRDKTAFCIPKYVTVYSFSPSD